MSTRAILFAATILAASPLAAASAAGPQDDPAAAVPQPAPAAEKKICRRVVPTGTIMTKRVCLTKSEWHAFGDESDKANEVMRNKRMNIVKRPDEL